MSVHHIPSRWLSRKTHQMHICVKQFVVGSTTALRNPMLILVGVRQLWCGMLKGMRGEERKEKGNTFFFCHPCKLFCNGKMHKLPNTNSLHLNGGILQSSFTWGFWLLWGGFCNFLSSVTMEESRNGAAGLTASWDFYFSVFIFQGGVLGYQQEIDCTNSFSLRVLDRSPEPQWMFKELNEFPSASVSCREGCVGFHAEASD